MSDTIDPNDLDSIDALLDETELEASEAEEVDFADEVVPDVPEVTASDESEDEDFLESLAEPESSEPEAELEPEVVKEPIRVPDDGEGMPLKTNTPAESENTQNMVPEVDPEAILAQRQKQKKNQTTAAQEANNISVKEMEALKKLIIIFSSVLIVLGLITIGLSTWAALSASKGLDEETKQTLEDIKTGANEATMQSMTIKKEVNGLHKKLDALSFQLEQLNGDLLPLVEKIGGGTPVATAPRISAAPSYATAGHGHGEHKEVSHNLHNAHTDSHVPASKHSAHGTMPVMTEPTVAQPAPMEAKIDPALIQKMKEVNRNVIKVQKRIAEINRRIKTLQQQYSHLLKGMKQVEKSVLQVKVKQKKEDKKKGNLAEGHKDPSFTPHHINPEQEYIYQAPDYAY